ncbi:MAG: hypothetical protein R3C53_07375 [Pirellulaceae bacterium]
MAVQIADFIYSGELRNTRRNSVFGWVEFAPDYGVRLELTGNFEGELAGKHIRFKNPGRAARNDCQPGEFPSHIEDLSDRQIGVVQSMTLGATKVPEMPIDEFLSLPQADREAHLVEKPSLRLHWSSQDGDVHCDLIEPDWEFVDEQDAMPDESNYEPFEGGLAPGFTEIRINENGDSEAINFDLDLPDDESLGEDEEQEDPYGLFDESLEDRVNQSLSENHQAELSDEEAPDDEHAADIMRHSWDIPDLDDETRELYEQWDEIFAGKKDEPISYLFPNPLKLPKPDAVSSDEEAEELVKAILANLALLSVALDVCEHFTPQQSYRLLFQEILPSAKVHPNLAASEMVQHYATSDYCQICADEFEAEYQADSDDDSDDD